MDPIFRPALADALRVAHRLGYRALLVGANARNLCLPPQRSDDGRRTQDADLALLLESWGQLDLFFDSCEANFEVRRPDMLMYHRATRVKLDVVPCGPIEQPPGTLRLRGDRRAVNTTGLSETFDTAQPLDIEGLTLLVPSPAAFVLLKLLAFFDRRQPRDLRDLGYVVRRFPVDQQSIWEDEAALSGLESESLTMEDMAAWQLGRMLLSAFQPETCGAFRVALAKLAAEPDPNRVLLVTDERGDLREMEEKLEEADRMIAVLRRSCAGD